MLIRFTLVLSLLFAMTTFGLANTPKAGHAEQLQFETILRAVREEPSLAPEALDVFRRIAENSAESITDKMEARFGMQPGQLRGPNSAYYFVRDHAFRAIGKIGTPEAIAYLEGLTGSDFDGEDRYRVWPAALEALQGARLERIASRQEKRNS